MPCQPSPAEAAARLLWSCCRTWSWVALLPEANASSAGEAPQAPAAVHAEIPSGHTSAHHTMIRQTTQQCNFHSSLRLLSGQLG